MKKVLGINYSGFHDTSISIVNNLGEIEFSCSLERESRVKQDSREPTNLLQKINLEEIDAIAISSNKELYNKKFKSIVHPVLFDQTRKLKYEHQRQFYDFISTLPNEKITFYDHELSHAASAFWLSGFEESICLVYDGGMVNNDIFGGIYKCSKQDGIELIDGFDIDSYAKITGLYTIITSILGFTPGKHEGKITGLAALGNINQECINVLDKWYKKKFEEMENIVEWQFSYSNEINAMLYTYQTRAKYLKNDLKDFTKETIAASLQYYTENHVIDILNNINKQGWLSENICLAGGLFANVKINQKIAEYENFKFKNIFIAPPMGDEGTALGAACLLVNEKYKQINFENNMFLGYEYSKDTIEKIVKENNLMYSNPSNPSKVLSQILADGKEIAFFEGRMEFGPRALGHRSIIAPANINDINKSLNNKLNRTEFMPFAPMTLKEHLNECYINIENKLMAMKYMTIACECTDEMKQNVPAVVHVDNTARPQIIDKDSGLIYKVMKEYYDLTSLSSVVNTSFNIHEEPIINTPYEAIKGFLTSGLSYLYFSDANILISYDENKIHALNILKNNLKKNNSSIKNEKLLYKFEEKYESCFNELIKKEEVIQYLKNENTKFKNNFYVKLLDKLGLIK